MISVIGGKLRGKKIEVPEKGVVPTKNRVREALFDIIGPDVSGSSFLDLFAGSGAVALEAYSRGASPVYCAEISKASCTLIKKNIAGTEISLYEGEHLKALKEYKEKGLSFTYIYIDPPYERTDLYVSALSAIREYGLLNDGGCIFIEYEGECPLPNEEGKTYNYGRSKLLRLSK